MVSLLRQRFTEDLRIRHYADRTVDAYVRCAAKFAQFFGKSPDVLGPEEVREGGGPHSLDQNRPQLRWSLLG